MKVVLLKDVPKVGKRYEVKNVSDGYALNSLIPKGLAEVATSGTMKKMEKIITELEAERKIQADLLAKNFKSIDGVKIVIQGKASDKGHLFAGIHKEEVVKSLKEQAHVDVLPDFIDMPHHIKEVGEHKITILAGDKKAQFIVEVQSVA